MAERRKVLFLSQRFLFPMDTGGRIRTGNILKKLNEIYSLTVISNVESPKDDPWLDRMDGICDKFIPVKWVEVKRYTMKFWLKLIGQMFSRYPVSVLNDYSPELVTAIEKEIKSEKYDLLICDFLQSTLNFRGIEGYPTLLFQHNVESAIVKRHLSNSKDPVSRVFWGLQTNRMMRHEGEASAEFDGVIAVSDKDKETFEDWFGLNNIYSIPTGVDTDFFKPDRTIPEKPQLVFTGSMDWLPNEDAISWFAEEILPKIQQQIPEATAVIVGRNPSPKIQRLLKDNSSVTLTGWVEDTRPYISEGAVFIVPIRVGGGTRMKIYEAMAMGKAIVSTTIGAEGLPITHNENIVIADDAETFAQDCIRLIREKEERDRIGDNARQYVYEHFRWDVVARVFSDVCEDVIEKHHKGK
jgi:glycosyltransferase involved in cell wall biosynthesis